MAASIRMAVMRINNQLRETLGLSREVNRRSPIVRFATNVEENLDVELKTERLTTNEE